MQSNFLDRYSRLNSPIHRIPAWAKLCGALALVIAIVAVPPTQRAFFVVAGAALVVVAGLSRIPPWFLLRRLLLLEPFVLGVAGLALFQPNGGRIFLFLVLRSTLCLLAMILLSNTTPFSEILRVLRAWRVPALLITTLSLMYRYIFVLIDETQRMRRARLSRSFVPGRSRVWRSLGTVIAQLFVRSSERAERIYAAMCARGWR